MGSELKRKEDGKKIGKEVLVVVGDFNIFVFP